MATEKVTVTALLKKDLREYVKNLGLSQALEKGEITCEVCHDPLNLDSIGAIYYEEHMPKFTCSKMICYQEIKQ